MRKRTTEQRRRRTDQARIQRELLEERWTEAVEKALEEQYQSELPKNSIEVNQPSVTAPLLDYTTRLEIAKNVADLLYRKLGLLCSVKNREPGWGDLILDISWVPDMSGDKGDLGECKPSRQPANT